MIDALVQTKGKRFTLLFSVDQVVVVLHADEPGPAMKVGQAEGLGELPGLH